MHYFVDMYDDKLNFLENISNDTCKEVLESYDNVSSPDLLYIRKLIEGMDGVSWSY